MDLKEAFSERMLFGILLIGGYLVLVGMSAFIPIRDAGILRDAMLVLGPIVGAIANAIYRSDKVDKSNAESIASLSESVARGTGGGQ